MKLKIMGVLLLSVIFSCSNPSSPTGEKVTSVETISTTVSPTEQQVLPGGTLTAPVRYKSLITTDPVTRERVTRIPYEGITISVVDGSGNPLSLEKKGDGIYSLNDPDIPQSFTIQRERDNVKQAMSIVRKESFSGQLKGVDLRLVEFDDGDRLSHNLEVFLTDSRGYPLNIMTFPNILVSDQLVMFQKFIYEGDRLTGTVTRRCANLILGEEVFEYRDDQIIGTYYYKYSYVLGSRSKADLREKRYYDTEFRLQRIERYLDPENTPGWTWETTYSGAMFTDYSGSVNSYSNIYYQRGEICSRSVTSPYSEAGASVQELYRQHPQGDRVPKWVTTISYIDKLDIAAFGSREIEIQDASHTPLYRRAFDSEDNTVSFSEYEYYGNGQVRTIKGYRGSAATPENLDVTRSYKYHDNGALKQEIIDSGNGHVAVYDHEA